MYKVVEEVNSCLSPALMCPMQTIQEVHALYKQTAKNSDNKLTEDRELAHIEVEGNQEQRH